MEPVLLCVRLIAGNRCLGKTIIVIFLVLYVVSGLILWFSSNGDDELVQPSFIHFGDRKQEEEIRHNGRRMIDVFDTERGVTSGLILTANKLDNTTKKREQISTISISPSANVTQSTSETIPDSCLNWCRRGNATKLPYYVAAVLLVRIYIVDKAKLTTREMIQWLQYLRYAGVEHVYVYDAYVYKNESQRSILKTFIDDGYVTYIDWSHNAYPYSIQKTQVAAYQDCINKWGRDSVWQAAIDIDEYPFSVNDTRENFLPRLLKEFNNTHPQVAEVTMQNYLFLGKPLNDTEHPLLVDRLWRRTKSPANPLVKPIYKPDRLSGAQVHHNQIRNGVSMNIPDKLLRMNHYWGARLQNWGDDTEEILNKTMEDRSMGVIIKEIQRCEPCLGRNLLYEKRWQ